MSERRARADRYSGARAMSSDSRGLIMRRAAGRAGHIRARGLAQRIQQALLSNLGLQRKVTVDGTGARARALRKHGCQSWRVNERAVFPKNTPSLLCVCVHVDAFIYLQF